MSFIDVFWDALPLLALIVVAVIVIMVLVKTLLKKLTGDDLKLYLDFFKWIVVSVALVLITTTIDTIFKDRTAGLAEVNQYDKYVELVIGQDVIGKRWRLAQFFQSVIPSKQLRDRWKEYYDTVSRDYRDSVALQKEYARKADSIRATQAYKQGDSSAVTALQHNTDRVQQLTAQTNTNVGEKLNPDSAALWESTGFNYLFERKADDAILAFSNAERYFHGFHNVFEILNYLIAHRAPLVANKDQEWKDLYKKILTTWRWRLTPDQVSTLQKLM